MSTTRWITHVNPNIPGGMCDKHAQHFIGENEWDRSILVDAGYDDVRDRRLIGPVGGDVHKRPRTGIEHVFGNTKRNNDSVGRFYRKHKDWHPVFITAAFILQNIRQVFGPKYQ